MTTTETRIDTIVFDLGAVLIDWNPEHLYRKVFDEEADMRHFLTEICTPEWNAQQDAGRSWDEAVDLLVKQHPKFEREIKLFRDRWPEMLAGPIDGTVEILQRLNKKGTHRLLALTNWSAETWPYAVQRFDFLSIFEGILVSGEEKLKKPDPKIYQLLSDRYGLEPGKTIFIDDSRANVDGARRFGWQAIHFTDPDALQNSLAAIGLL